MRLDSVNAKSARANEHAGTLKDEVRAWIDEKTYRLVPQVNADFTRYSVILRIEKAPDFERWALLLGDAVHNLRAALDHLVYAISVHELKTDPPHNEGVSAFLINDSPNDFRSKYWRIKDLSRTVCAAIESVQPYNRKHALLPPLLAVLRDLDDSDKHRLIPVVLSQPTEGYFENIRNLIAGQQVAFIIHAGSVKDGTEVGAIVLDRPTLNVQYNFQISLSIAARHAVGPKGHTMTGVAELVNDFLIPEVNDVIGIVRAAVSP